MSLIFRKIPRLRSAREGRVSGCRTVAGLFVEEALDE